MAVAHRIYARALFDAAKDLNRLSQVHEELGDFVAATRDVPELRALLENPEIDHRTKQDALGELLAGGEEIARNFLLLLIEKGRAAELEETKRQIEAETHRALGEIRRAVADLALVAAARVTRGALDPKAHRTLIDDAIKELDFSKLEKEPV